jgi:hypothetical protein
MVLYDKLIANRSQSSMALKINKILNNNDNIILYKNTKITLDDDVLKIQHSGKEYDDMNVVNYILYKLGIANSIDEMKHYLVELDESGHPNYYYVIRFQV